MSRKLIIIALFFISGLIASCSKKVSQFPSSPRLTTQGSLDVPARWSTSLLTGGRSLPFRISQDFLNDFNPDDIDGMGYNPFEQMAFNWDEVVPELNFFTLPSGEGVINLDPGNLDSYQDAVMGVYKSYAWFNEVSSDALAVTVYSAFRRNVGTSSEYLEMVHADIIYNYRDYDFTLYGDTQNGYDLQTILLHELGHFIGLPHEFDFSIPSVMHPFLDIKTIDRELYHADIQAIRQNYQLQNLREVLPGPIHPDEGQFIRGFIEYKPLNFK